VPGARGQPGPARYGKGITDVRGAGRYGHGDARPPWPSAAWPRSASRTGASFACRPECRHAALCAGTAGEPSPGSGPPRYGSPTVCPLLVVSDARAARRTFHFKPLKIVSGGAKSQEGSDPRRSTARRWLVFTRRSRGTSRQDARATARRATFSPPPDPSGPANP